MDGNSFDLEDDWKIYHITSCFIFDSEWHNGWRWWWSRPERWKQPEAKHFIQSIGGGHLQRGISGPARHRGHRLLRSPETRSLHVLNTWSSLASGSATSVNSVSTSVWRLPDFNWTGMNLEINPKNLREADIFMASFPHDWSPLRLTQFKFIIKRVWYNVIGRIRLRNPIQSCSRMTNRQ